MREEPILRKCCYCIPLQSCLHAWAIVKIIADTCLVLLMILLMFTILCFDPKLTKYKPVLGIFSIALGAILDLVFMVTLSIGLCKKSVKALNVFYYYNIAMTVIVTCIFVAIFIYDMVVQIPQRDHIIGMIVVLVWGIIYIGLSLCVAVVAKSEMIKLRQKEQYEFVKIPIGNTEPEIPNETKKSYYV